MEGISLDDYRARARDLDGSEDFEDLDKEMTVLLRSKKADLSAPSSFRIASELIDSAASTILNLRARIRSLEAEREKAQAQEIERQYVLDRWQEIATGLKNHIRELERKLAEANRRAINAEIRAQNAEESITTSESSSLKLCDKVIAAFGSEAAQAIDDHPEPGMSQAA